MCRKDRVAAAAVVGGGCVCCLSVVASNLSWKIFYVSTQQHFLRIDSATFLQLRKKKIWHLPRNKSANLLRPHIPKTTVTDVTADSQLRFGLFFGRWIFWNFPLRSHYYLLNSCAWIIVHRHREKDLVKGFPMIPTLTYILSFAKIWGAAHLYCTCVLDTTLHN